MLKIKDDESLKELKKLYYIPKYDVDTGEINKYIYEVRTSEEKTKTTYVEIIKTTRVCGALGGLPYYKTYWQVQLKDLQKIDVIYDLIKADLVEKIED